MAFKRIKTSHENLYNKLDLKKSLKNNAQFNILLSERSTGKSFAVKDYAIEESLTDTSGNSKFIYLRRYKEDITSKSVNKYLTDIVSSGKLKEITKGKYNNFKVVSREIFAVKVEDDKEIESVVIGYSMCLAESERYKTQAYNDVARIVFEEFITHKSYPSSEIDDFESIISTVARRDGIEVILVGNTIDRNCPYFSYWSLRNVPKQKLGTTEIYNFETEQFDEQGEPIITKILVEMCNVKENNTRMIASKDTETNVNGGWSSKSQAKIKIDLTRHSKIYEIVVQDLYEMYYCVLYQDKFNSNIFWFVAPKTTEIQKGTRVISDVVSDNILWSKRLYAISPQEKYIFNLLKQDKIFFSDNLTGTQFKNTLRKICV